MLKVLPVFIFSFLILSSVSGQTINGSMEHDGVEREYILHLPAAYDETVSYPFVYNLHGYTSNATEQQFYSAMDITADQNGFIVCYPEGLQNSWNVGFPFGSEADDVGFLLSLVDSLSAEYNINQDRLYSCGMSNGGYMSYKLACEAGDRFAAIASVTGSIVPSQLSECTPIRPFPIMQIHGTADLVVPYNGTPFIAAPIEEVLDFWIAENECGVADTIVVEDINTTDNSTALRIEYNTCLEGTEVLFYKIDNGAHTWPDATINTGTTNRDFNGSQEVWNFFNRYDLNGAIISSTENEIAQNQIKVFPNPASADVLNISDLPSAVTELRLYDTFGKLLKVNTVSNELAQMNIEDLSAGLYILQAEGEDFRAVEKFIRQ